MHKTVYIDIDEEIIGIINKIKNTEASEIFLVVPKNSLLTQGIVNLKLLKKEVLKMGKKIILVTSDQHARLIIKRVGLETKSKSVQDFVPSEQAENNTQIAEQQKGLESSNVTQKPKKREIGSSSFYDLPPLEQTSKEKITRNNSLKIDPSHSDFKKNRKLQISSPNTFGIENIENYERKNKEKIKEFDKSNFSKKNLFVKKSNPKPLIDDFYRNKISKKDLMPNSNSVEKKIKNKKSGIKKIVFAMTIVLSLIVLTFAGFWAFSSWPKMTIELFLEEQINETTLNLKICDDETSENDCLKGSYKELTIETTNNYDSSGEEFSNDKGMARGLVKIYNNYSSQSQPLVEKTRLLSSEGKLFRLIKGVTVPGMEDGEPGEIEALVIADEIGQSYNIESSEFTIEGFKGSEKYEKFKVISDSKMTGGANDIENKKVKVVTESDINSAREKTIENFNNSLEGNLKEQLGESEIFVVTSVDKEIISSDSSYAPGDIIDKFNYTVKEKIKLITFDQEDFQNLIIDKFNREVDDNFEFEKITQIDYQKDITNYDTKTLDLVIVAKALYWPKLNIQEIKKKITEKNNDEIKEYLGEINQIKKALITYQPAWLSTLPIKNENISVLETK